MTVFVLFCSSNLDTVHMVISLERLALMSYLKICEGTLLYSSFQLSCLGNITLNGTI